MRAFSPGIESVKVSDISRAILIVKADHSICICARQGQSEPPSQTSEEAFTIRGDLFCQLVPNP